MHPAIICLIVVSITVIAIISLTVPRQKSITRKIADKELDSYLKARYAKLDQEILEATDKAWSEVQRVRRDSYEEIFKIKLEIEQAKNELNILKDEKNRLTSASLIQSKDQELGRMYDVIKTLSARGSK